MTVYLDKLYSLLIENTEALYIALHFLGMSLIPSHVIVISGEL